MVSSSPKVLRSAGPPVTSSARSGTTRVTSPMGPGSATSGAGLPESRVSRSTADRITRIRPRGQFEEDKDSSLRPGGEVYPGRGENTAAPHQGGTESRRVLGSKVQTDLEFSDLLAL